MSSGTSSGLTSTRKRRTRRSGGSWTRAIFKRPILALGILVLCGGVAAAVFSGGYTFLTKGGPPAKWRLNGQDLIVMDFSGRDLWRHKFPEVWLQPAYRPGLENRRFWFGYLDDKETVTTLAAYLPADESQSGLYSFSDDGKLNWSFQPGHVVEDGANNYRPPYAIANFRVIPPQVGRQALIVVSSRHARGHPDQVAVLDANGKIVSEYWHSGALTEMAVTDMNGTGKDSVMLAGVDSGKNQGTLILLDPDKASGATVEEAGDPHQLKGFAPGTEQVMVFFPKAELKDLTVSGGEVRLSAPPLTYVFDKKLNLISVTGSGKSQEELRQEVTVVRKAH